MYIHENDSWPHFTWDAARIERLLAAARNHQGFFLGTMKGLGFTVQQESMLASMTTEIVKSSEIEGEALPPSQVRLSIERKLGLATAGLTKEHRQVEGVVTMTLDAVKSWNEPLTKERLFAWHREMFEGSRANFKIGAWRDDAEGPMQIVSGQIGSYRVHYEAPAANKLEDEMARFLEWENADQGLDPVLKAGLAHFWFVAIHPFGDGDGNGRIARAITERSLTRAENGSRRFYSLSAQIMKERNDYYHVLEVAQKGSVDATGWFEWYLGCFDRALSSAEALLGTALRRDAFWKAHASASLNQRQKDLINRLLDGFVGKLRTSKWATLAKCSQDTAGRDISELVGLGILVKDEAGGRSTSYSLAPFGA
jgi:Fic family protein